MCIDHGPYSKFTSILTFTSQPKFTRSSKFANMSIDILNNFHGIAIPDDPPYGCQIMHEDHLFRHHATMDRVYDCDCLILGTCVSGEPLHKPTIEEAWPGPMFPVDPTPVKRSLRPIWQNLQDWLGKPPPPGPWNKPPKARKPKPDKKKTRDYLYSYAIIRVLEHLPPDVQASIRGEYMTIEPFVKDYKDHKILLHGPHMIDPRAAMSAILGDPEYSGQVIVQQSKKQSNLVLYCTSQIFDHIEKTTLPESLNDTSKDLLPRDARLPYFNAIKRIIGLWRAHTPEGLSRNLPPDEIFSFVSFPGNGTINLERIEAQQICSDVHANSIVGPSKQAPNIAKIPNSIDSISHIADHMSQMNTFLREGAMDKEWKSVQKMDWNTTQMEKVFGEQTGEMQIALSYLALSIETGFGMPFYRPED